MKKITILEIGIAGGIYNLLAMVLADLIVQSHIQDFGRLFVMIMQRFGGVSCNFSMSGVMSSYFWAFLGGGAGYQDSQPVFNP